MERHESIKRMRIYSSYTETPGQLCTPIEDNSTSFSENDMIDPLPSIDLIDLLEFSFPKVTFAPWRRLSFAARMGYKQSTWFAKWRTNKCYDKCLPKPQDLAESLESMHIDDGYGSMSQERPKVSPHWDLYEILTHKDEDGDIFLNICIISEQSNMSIWIINLSPSPACVNIPNRLFQTPLHLGVCTEQPEIVRRLMIAGANLDARDARGNTALHIACQLGLIYIIEILLEPISDEETSDNTYNVLYSKPNLELRNCDGLTCFHIAVLRYDMIMMDLLASAGSNINAKELKSGKTPLHIAVESGDIFVVNFLLNLELIDVNDRMYNGTSAVELAYHLEYHAIILLLHQKGATYFAPDLDESESDTDYSDSGSDWEETFNSVYNTESIQCNDYMCTHEEDMEEDQTDSGIREEFEQHGIKINLSVERSETETESKLETQYLIGKVKPETNNGFHRNHMRKARYYPNFDGNIDLGYDSD